MSLDWLADPWSSGLMRRAFFEAALTGVMCGGLGCFVLVRGLAFLGESVSHTIVLGVILAFLAGLPVGLGAAALAAATVPLVAAIAADRRFSADTATGVLLPSLFGAGVLLIAVSEGYRSRLEDVLFGSVLAVTSTELALTAAAALAVGVVLLLAGKELVLVAFDRTLARALGYRVRLLDLLLLTAVTAAVVVALRSVGTLLLTGLLLGPPAIARLLCRTFWRMAALAAAVGAGAGLAGLYLTWYLDVPGGAGIVLVVAALFAGTAVVTRVGSARAARAAVALVVAGLALGCGSDDGSPGGSRPIDVVATTMQLQDFARQVGGQRVRVAGILDHDAEPHEYEPTPSDADAVSGAELVVENGAGLDDWLGDLLENAGSDARRVTASEGMELLPSGEEGFPGDPHVWHDPALAKKMVDRIAAGLSAADPAGRRSYQRNAARYKRRIDSMAAAIRAEFAAVPPEDRNLVTSHDAFGYFARAYDVDVVGSVLPTLSTETEPSGRQLRELIDAIRAQRVKVIFTEAAVHPKLEERVAEEAGAEVSTSLHADALGAPGSGAETFIRAELANARAMKEAWVGGGD